MALSVNCLKMLLLTNVSSKQEFIFNSVGKNRNVEIYTLLLEKKKNNLY